MKVFVRNHETGEVLEKFWFPDDGGYGTYAISFDVPAGGRRHLMVEWVKEEPENKD